MAIITTDSPKQIINNTNLNQKEFEKIVYGFNKTKSNYALNETFIEKFEQQVSNTPDNIALVHKFNQLTYKELNEKANQLAWSLINSGIKVDTPVAIMVDRSLEMIIATIAILKAGGAYLPIETSYPEERIQYLLENSQAPILLTQEKFIKNISINTKILDLEDQNIYSNNISNPDNRSSMNDLAYIIYTSGSTGKPKGVMIENKALMNMSLYFINQVKLTEEDNVSKNAAFGFDASVLEIFPTLITGATLYIIPEDIRLSLNDINEYFEANNITICFFTTQFGEQFIDMIDNQSLRYLVVGGEKLKTFKTGNYKLLNIYGPTEYTVYTTSCVVNKAEENIPIGKPVANSRIYILNEENKIVPIGQEGELCVSGENIARGYLFREELTAKKFVDNPYEPGTKMYRTGDLARWLPDGNIQYAGRKDFQVKIRGFRIELGEIEQHILQFEHIKEAVVIDKEDSKGNKYLCGYFVASSSINIDDLKKFLAITLPDYMIPANILQLDKMPLTPNGKVNRKELPEITISSEGFIKYIAAKTDNEKALAKIWEEVLLIEKPGINDNFFNLGGHSLKAVFMQAKIQKELNIKLPLNQIMKHPTIKELSEILPEYSKTVHSEILPLQKKDYYELSASQKRLFFIEQMKGIGTTYNVPFILEIEGKLDTYKLSKSLDTLVNRHEALRTSFEIIEGKPKQIIHDRVYLKKLFRTAKENALTKITERFIQTFDLSKAPLLKVELVQVDLLKHYLLLDFHHIIIDGVSVASLLKELCTLYNNEKLAPLKVQFKEFAAWQNKLLSSNEIEKQEQFWLKSFEGDIPVLEMPTDYPYPSTLDYIGDEITIQLDPSLSKNIYKFCAQSRTTPYTLFMSAYNVLLNKYTSQEDIIVGTPVSGRNHSDLENVLGMFVNTIPIRTYPAYEKRFTDFLGEVNTYCLSAFENQDYQLDTLIDKLNIQRNSNKHPLFDVALVFQNIGINQFTSGDINIKPLWHKKNDAKFDLLLEILEDNKSLTLNWNFRKSLFKKETINNMAKHFINLLNSIIENPDQLIKDINIISKAEELQLLFDFNDTHVNYPKNTCIHQMFEDQVKNYPERIAVSFEDESISYKELNEKANQLARFLKNKGVTRDAIVCILLDRSINMIISLLGILKAGGCYLPINPDYPEDRTNYILENSQTKYLLTTNNYINSITLNGEKFDVNDKSIYQGDSSNLDNINEPEDLAYIIYTSGSTGKPKGVMIQHKNVIRLLKNDKNLYDFNENDVWTMFHSFCFDFSVWEIYGAILFGGKCVIVNKAATLSPQEFLKLLKKEQVTILNQTPGAFYNLIEEDLKNTNRDLNIRYVIFGGEALQPLQLKDWHKKYPETRLINMYGITETTVHVTFKEITDYEIENNISNIGTPIPTLTTYIMDKNLHLCPIGIIGEICVGGDGVARGYVNNPELTAKRFVENPYPPHDRIYRSGDLAKILPNGEMVYYGRMDFQVKIRGFRIELAEIEDKLLKSPNIKKCIVLAKEEPGGNKVLVAYMVMENDMSVPELRSYLSEDLPDYMIPSYFIKMEELPLTSNKKVDRRALPDPTTSIDTGIKYVAPENKSQKVMVKIWQKVLGIEKIGINDNFFALGGHSLKAVSLIAEMQKHFKVNVNDIFEHQSIAELSDNIEPISDNTKTKLENLKSLVKDLDLNLLEEPDIKPAYTKYLDSNTKYKNLDLTQQKNYNNILLTGTTGYLGIYLLADLLKTTDAKIFCIVRGNSKEKAQLRLRNKFCYYFGEETYNNYNNRIQVLVGDLSKDNLGLEPDQYADLTECINCIIHSAAIVRHYGHYEEFYNANVQATINLLELAKTNRIKDFNHISTISVGMGKIQDKDKTLFTEYDCDIKQECDNYYVKTKLEAEKQVLAARDSGIVSNIYRIGNITFNSESGLLQDNIEENAFFNTVKSFINLGIVPDKADEAELSFVDQVSQSILTLFDKKSLENETYHIQNTHIIKISDLLSSPDLKLTINKVSFDSFIDFITQNYDKEALRPYIENVLLHSGWLSENAEETKFAITTDKTELILNALGFNWKEVAAETLNQLIIKALEQRIEFLKTVPVFDGLGIEEINQLAKASKEIICERNSTVTIEDQPDKTLYIVVDGFVEMCRHSKSGWLGTIMVLNSTDFFDEDIFRNEEVATMTANVVLEDARILAIKDEELFKLIEKSPKLGRSLLSGMSERIRRLEKLIVSIG